MVSGYLPNDSHDAHSNGLSEANADFDLINPPTSPPDLFRPQNASEGDAPDAIDDTPGQIDTARDGSEWQNTPAAPIDPMLLSSPGHTESPYISQVLSQAENVESGIHHSHGGFESDLVVSPSASKSHGIKNTLHAALLRYFVEELARSFDLCDSQRHFATVVPRRAAASPPLLNAIFTISARILFRLRKFRNAAGVIEWRGVVLPNLTQESAVYFHNECIRELLKLSMDPQQVHNQDLLIAATILRTDEEMDASMRDSEDDQEIFLRMLSLFLNAQVRETSALPAISPTQPGPSPHALSPYTPSPVDSLSQALFWIALRQELLSSFLKQRPLKFPLAYYEPFRSLSPTDDAMWANRLVLFCADVFQYCFGAEGSDSRTNSERWNALRAQEHEIKSLLPDSFDPIYYCAPRVEDGEVFPQVWYLADHHVTGTTHAELSSILLSAFDPTRPRLGPGSTTSAKELTSKLRESILKLCGIALSNRGCPPVFLEALMGIATCGEYLDDRREQEAVIGVLGFMSDEFAYPTEKVAGMLKRAWEWSV